MTNTRLFLSFFLFTSLMGFAQKKTQWQVVDNPILTPWAASITNPEQLWNVYPRPQMQRNSNFIFLNGFWEYAITDQNAPVPAKFDGAILVPFCVESALSGVKKTLLPHQKIYYQRSLKTNKNWKKGKILLHFEAVDWAATISIDGKIVGQHQGGYDPFFFDISAYVKPGKMHTLTVAVSDPTNAPDAINPRGKQVLDPGGIYYTPVSGIWQTVWLEHVPETFIEDYHVRTDIDKNTVSVAVIAQQLQAGDQIKVSVLSSKPGEKSATILAQQTDLPGKTITLTLKAPQLWSPENPYLYGLTIDIIRNNKKVDGILGYFGMRKISFERGKDGSPRILLNNKFVFQNGPLDQGFWPDGIYTPPSPAAMRFDLEQTKAMGFNMLRKHVKVEPRLFYRQADEIGLLVWQDMPSTNGFGHEKIPELTFSEAHSANFRSEMQAMIKTHWNHPCIVIWVPFNEGWGQHKTREMGEWVKKLDPDRLVNFTSGWTDMGGGDMLDIHHYPNPALPTPQKDRAMVLGEFGGLGLKIEGHTWQKENWGYQKIDNAADLLSLYEDFYRSVFQMRDTGGLSACVYTQTTDVETETNGLITYDRKVIKLKTTDLAAVHHGYFSPQVLGESRLFLDKTNIIFAPIPVSGGRIRYTLDGTDPEDSSPLFTQPILLQQTTTLKARSFFPNGHKSAVKTWEFKKVAPVRGVDFFRQPDPGLKVQYAEGGGSVLSDFIGLKPLREKFVYTVDLSPAEGKADEFSLTYTGFLNIPQTGVYTFYLSSDDGSALRIGETNLIENDGSHGDLERSGEIALQKGFHPIRLQYFQNRGGSALRCLVSGPSLHRQEIPGKWMHH